MKTSVRLSKGLLRGVVFCALLGSGSTAVAQAPQRLIADTGIVTLGPNQILRITVGGRSGDDLISVRFKRMGYELGPCNDDGVCKQAVASQTQSAPATVTAGEAVWFDIDQTGYAAVRGIVSGNYIGTNAGGTVVNAQIVDTLTGEVRSILIALLLP